MRLKIVYKACWRICSPITIETDDKPLTALEAFLSEQETQYQGSVDGMLALIQRAATLRLGPRGLTRDQCHPANTAEPDQTIWQFIKGDLRIFFFMDGADRIVVCACGALKKGQKADRGKVAEAQRAKSDYETAKRQGRLVMKE